MPTSLDLSLIGNSAIDALIVINRAKHLPTAWGAQP
jgi:hypothetical protein